MRACVEQERRLKRIKHTHIEKNEKEKISTLVVSMSCFFTSAHLYRSEETSDQNEKQINDHRQC